jgi:GT2 family glycosyltransferase
MNIGVGITSLNRPEALLTCLRSVRCFSDPPFDLYVSDDGSTRENVQAIAAACQECTAELDMGERVGIAKNKNRILRRFRDYDFIFILEDDLYVRDPAWIFEHLRAHEDTGIHHFGHVLPNVMGVYKEVDFPGGRRVLFTEHCTGMFGFYTRTVLETVGGFDPRFDLYGWEHMDYSERIRKAGLCGTETAGYPCLSNIHELVESMCLDSTLNCNVRGEQTKKNFAVWELSRGETNLYRGLE